MKRLILAVFLAAVLFSGVAFAEEATNTWTINYATPSTGLYGDVATISYPLRSGVPPLMYIGDVASRSIEYVSYDKPLPTVGTFSISSIQIFEVGGAVATWAHLDSLRSQYVNIASMNVPLPTGTNDIGGVNISEALPTGTNDIGGVSLSEMIPAGTNAIGSVTIIPQDTASFPMSIVGEYVLPVASTTVGSFTTAAYTIPLVSGAKSILITLNSTSKEVWVRLGGDAPTVGNGIRVSNNLFIDKLNSSEVIKVIASETLSASWVQR